MSLHMACSATHVMMFLFSNTASMGVGGTGIDVGGTVVNITGAAGQGDACGALTKTFPPDTVIEGTDNAICSTNCAFLGQLTTAGQLRALTQHHDTVRVHAIIRIAPPARVTVNTR